MPLSTVCFGSVNLRRCAGGELPVREIPAWALELRLLLVVRRWRHAGWLKHRKVPIGCDHSQAALEGFPGDTLFPRVGPDSMPQPVSELRLNGCPCFQRLRLHARGTCGKDGVQDESQGA